jgi:hypothetical protein
MQLEWVNDLYFRMAALDNVGDLGAVILVPDCHLLHGALHDTTDE